MLLFFSFCGLCCIVYYALCFLKILGFPLLFVVVSNDDNDGYVACYCGKRVIYYEYEDEQVK